MGREFEELGGTLDAPGPGVPGFPDTREIAVDVIEDDETITVLADLPWLRRRRNRGGTPRRDSLDHGHHDETRDTEVTVDEDDATADDAVEGDAAEGADTGGDDSSEAGGGDDVRYHRRERRRRAVSRRIPIPSPSTATARPPRTTTVYSPSPFPSGRRTMPATTSTCRDVAGREASVTAVIGLNPRIPAHKLSTILSSLIPQSTSLMVIIMNRNSPFDEIEQFLGRAPSAATARGGVTSGPPTSMWPSTTTSSWSWPTSRDTTAKTSTCGRRRAAYDYRRARCGERGRGPTVSPARAAPRVGHSVRRPSGTRRRRGRERDVPPRRPHDHAPEGCRRDGRRPPDRRGVRALFGFARSLFFRPLPTASPHTA